MKTLFASLLLTAAAAAPALAGGAAERQAILDDFRAEAGVEQFSAERGEALFRAEPGTGKPETPSCTTCHGDDPTQAGRTRIGKKIEPMAVSVTPERFTDRKKVAKWFRRNCDSVLGRECTAREKGDFITFMLSR